MKQNGKVTQVVWKKIELYEERNKENYDFGANNAFTSFFPVLAIVPHSNKNKVLANANAQKLAFCFV